MVPAQPEAAPAVHDLPSALVSTADDEDAPCAASKDASLVVRAFFYSCCHARKAGTNKMVMKTRSARLPKMRASLCEHFFHSCRHAPRGAPGHKQPLKSFFHLFCFSALFNMLQYLQEQHHSTEHERRGGILGRTLKCDAALSSTNKWDIEPGLLDLAISQFLFSHRRQTLLLFLYFSVRVVIFL
jgi:hypothetical protein